MAGIVGVPEGKGALLNSGPGPPTVWTLRLRAGRGRVWSPTQGLW